MPFFFVAVVAATATAVARSERNRARRHRRAAAAECAELERQSQLASLTVEFRRVGSQLRLMQEARSATEFELRTLEASLAGTVRETTWWWLLWGSPFSLLARWRHRRRVLQLRGGWEARKEAVERQILNTDQRIAGATDELMAVRRRAEALARPWEAPRLDTGRR